MKKRQNLGVLGLGFVEFQIIFWLSIWLAFPQQAAGLRPIREKARTWSDEVYIFIIDGYSKVSSFRCFPEKKFDALALKFDVAV